jgi:hypothetical protein
VPRPRSIAALAALAVLAAASPAAAIDPPRWHFGGSLSFTQLWGGPTASGFGAGMHGTFAINDSFQILARADVTAHPYARWVLAGGTLGAAYVVDVDRWIPWIGAAAGPLALISVNPACGASIAEPCHALRVSLEIPFGVDYQLTPRLAVGLGGRYQMILLGDVPWSTLSASARVEVTWGK